MGDHGVITCGRFLFYCNFDSANLGRVEILPPNEAVVARLGAGSSKTQMPDVPDAEFNVWTKRDCQGSEFENANRTWFYFGMKAPESCMNVRLNLVDLNRQGKMYSQGMAPVYRILPGKSHWDRVREKPAYSISNDIFTLSFKVRSPENPQSIMYFAFTYPFSYAELEKMLLDIDTKYLPLKMQSSHNEDDIYYVRECVCCSLEGRSIELLTISSHHGITQEREERLNNLFPNKNVLRPFKFVGKKVIFISARVHPGETPSSFVFNGLLSCLLNRDDLVAINLRKLYVFKLIPFLNPDGVARGHYRTDTKGVNLNRVYLNPSFKEHPSVYAARALIRYYHYGIEKEDNPEDYSTNPGITLHDSAISQQVSVMTLNECDKISFCIKCKENLMGKQFINEITPGKEFSCRNCGCCLEADKIRDFQDRKNYEESGIYLYIDLHGHASKKGIFMYGNHFEDLEKNVECMLLPKLMSLNNHHFHFNACNFTERNMFLRDKRDGMSRAGSGRVSVLSLTGIIKSYTLECNYNTGRMVNVLPPTLKEVSSKVHSVPVPPKYTPAIYEEVGKSLAQSILDLTGQNPWSRLPNSEFHTLSGLKEWLRLHSCNDFCPKIKPTSNLQSQGKQLEESPSYPARTKTKGLITCKGKKNSRSSSVPSDRKENLVAPIRKTGKSSVTLSDNKNFPASCSYVASKSAIRLNKCYSLKKSRKDLSKGPDKVKGTLARNKTKLNVTPQKVRLDITNNKAGEGSSEVQLREICFIKNSEGKTMIAKYKNKEGEEVDDKLVVSWEGSTANPHIFTQKSRVSSAPAFLSSSKSSEPSTSKASGVFRVHNFSKNATLVKTKLKKYPLRRLASTGDSSLSKMDKKKKKLKAK